MADAEGPGGSLQEKLDELRILEGRRPFGGRAGRIRRVLLWAVLVMDPVNAPARTPRATFRPQLVAGRGLRGEEREKTVAVVGRQYAETHTTAAGYKVSEMVYPGHTPGVIVGTTRVEVVGIFESGSADGDKVMIAPLSLAQKLAGAPEAVSLITVTPRSPADVQAIRKAVEAALGGKVEVRVAGQ